MSIAQESERNLHVAIVGGGLAGLAAAEALARANPDSTQVTLIEAKRATGGRAGSFYDDQSGESIDYCQHVAMGCCTNFLKLMERCGLSDQFARYDELTFLHPNHAPSLFRPSRLLPAPLHMLPTLGQLNYLKPKQRREIRRGLWCLMRTKPESLGSTTAQDWLRQHGQTEQTIADFWDVILVSALGEQTSFVTMKAARKVFIDGFAAVKGASDVFVPKIPLTELIGQRLTKAIKALGVKFSCGDPVKAISNQLTPTIALKSAKHIEPDQIICAVPWHQLASILDPQSSYQIDHFDQLTSIPSSPITGIHLWLDREITDRPHAVLVGTLSQWLFRDPVRTQQENACYYQVVISASRDVRSLQKSELIESVMKELGAMFPRAVEAKVVRYRIVTDPKSVFSIRPEFDAIRPSSTTPLPWLHLAGDWIATGWPATMEGAVISGQMAASSVLEQQGRKLRTVCTGLKPGLLSRLLIR